MVRNVQEFLQRTNGKFSRSNLFKVEILGTKDAELFHNTENVNFLCSSAQIPGITLTTTEKALDYKSRGKQKLYDDITLSFYCTENMNELRFFNRWMNTIINPISNRVEYYDNYTASVKITTLSKDPNINTNYISNAKTNNKELLVVTLHEAFPKRIEPIQMDYTAGSEVMKLNITMTYRYHTMIQQIKPDNIPTGTVYATHNVNTEDNKVDPMREIRNDGEKFRSTDNNETSDDLEF